MHHIVESLDNNMPRGWDPWESLDVWDISPRKTRLLLELVWVIIILIEKHAQVMFGIIFPREQNPKKSLKPPPSILYRIGIIHLELIKVHGTWEITSHLNLLLSHKLCCCIKDSNPKSPKKNPMGIIMDGFHHH